MPQDAQDNIAQMRANLGRAFDAYPRQLMTPESPFQKYVRDRNFSQLSDKAKRGLALFIGKAACNECHNGPALMDNKFHNVGAPGLTLQPVTNATIAPNRGRAGVIPAILANLAALQANPNAPIFNGAGKYSDNPTLGLQRLLEVQKEDQDHCVTRDPMTMVCTLYDESLEGAFRTLSLLNCAQSGPYFHSGTVNSLEDVVRQYNAGGGPPGMYVGTVDPKVRPLLLTEIGDCGPRRVPGDFDRPLADCSGGGGSDDLELGEEHRQGAAAAPGHDDDDDHRPPRRRKM